MTCLADFGRHNVDIDGKQSTLADGVNDGGNITLATRQALLNMIDLLMDRGYSREQAYCICSVAVDFKVSEVVDLPNVVVSAFLPLDIFGD